MKLSREQVRQFKEDGVIVVEDLLDRDEVERLKAYAEGVARGESGIIPKKLLQVEPRVARGEARADSDANSLRKMAHLAFYDPVFLDHARSPKILDVVESLMGPDIKLYQDQLFMKPPGVGSRKSYHQDMPCGFHIDPPEMVTCWAALDDSTVQNGCVRMIPGSHRNGILDTSIWEAYEKKALEGPFPEERALEMRKGSCSFHHGLILHSSHPNTSDKPRRGYATHYVSARCLYTGPQEENDTLLMRGRPHPGCI